jgi:hypothetical protein
MDSDNFDEFLNASKEVGNGSITILMFNNKFNTKVGYDWYRNGRYVDNDSFKIINEVQEYAILWDKLIPDKDARYRTIRLTGAKALFKGRRTTGLTFTRNDADLVTKNCYVLEEIESLEFGPEELNLKQIDGFSWVTPIMFLKPGKKFWLSEQWNSWQKKKLLEMS